MRSQIRDVTAAVDAGIQATLATAYGSMWTVIGLVVILPALLGVMPETVVSMRPLAHAMTLGVDDDATMMAIFVLELIWLPAVAYGSGIAIKSWASKRGGLWRHTINGAESAEDAA